MKVRQLSRPSVARREVHMKPMERATTARASRVRPNRTDSTRNHPLCEASTFSSRSGCRSKDAHTSATAARPQELAPTWGRVCFISASYWCADSASASIWRPFSDSTGIGNAWSVFSIMASRVLLAFHSARKHLPLNSCSLVPFVMDLAHLGVAKLTHGGRPR